MNHCAPLLALVLASGVVVAQSANSAWVLWLRAHLSAIQIAATGVPDDFADLQFLKDVVGDRRIVQIGESHHSVAEYHRLKTRLVQFLHAEMGFDVLAFESSIYELYAANLAELDPRDAIRATIFPVWATDEMVPLFDYLRASAATERPLALVGFDTQISSYSAVTSRPAFFRRVLDSVDADYARAVERFDEEFVDRIRREGMQYARAEEARLIEWYDALADFIRRHREAIDDAFPGSHDAFFAERAAWSTARFVHQLRSFADNPDDPTDEGHFVLRDRAMADNVTTIARDLYPGKKIIVWAANLHVRHANQDTSYEFPTMGSWLVERFRDELYTIGLYPNRGQFTNGNRAVRTLDPAAPGTMQHLLTSAGASPMFIDLLHREEAAGTAWMFSPMVAPEPEPIGNGTVQLSIVPRQQYDGLLFVDLINAPRFFR